MLTEIISVASLIGSGIAVFKSFQTLRDARQSVQVAQSISYQANGYSTAAQASARAAEGSLEKANRAAVSAEKHAGRASESADTFQDLVRSMAANAPKPPRTREQAYDETAAAAEVNQTDEDRRVLEQAQRLSRTASWVNRSAI